MQAKSKEHAPAEPAHNNYQTAKKQPNHRQSAVDSTPKRNRYEQDRASPQMSRNRVSKQHLMQLYKQLMDSSQYTQAENTNKAIIHIRASEASRKERKLSQNHSKEKQAVRRSHLWEMQVFRQSWNEVFMKQEMQERLMAGRLQQLRHRDQLECRDRIARRCKSAKPRMGFARLNQIQQMERSLRKRGKTVELRALRYEKQKTIAQCKKAQQEMVQKIAEQEQKRMAEKETKRYRSFMHRVEQHRQDNIRIYRGEEHRLKQKYKNILKNLQHEQKIEWGQLKKILI